MGRRLRCANGNRRALGGSEVVGHLLQIVADDAELKLVVEEVRSAPVDMEIHPVQVLGVRVLEIVGQAGDPREFIAGLWM